MPGAVVEVFGRMPQDRQERIAEFSTWAFPRLMRAVHIGEACSVSAYQAAQIMASVLDPGAPYAKPPQPAEVWYNCLWGTLQEPGWAMSAGNLSVQTSYVGRGTHR